MKWIVLACGLVACGGGSGQQDASNPPIVEAALDAAVDASPDAHMLPPGAPQIGACRSERCWVFPLPQGNALRAIWGSSATDVWVAGDHETLLHFTGTGSVEYVMNVQQVWGTAANDAWAIGPSNVWRWNGTTWAVTLAEGGSLVGGTGPNDVWAVTTTAGAKQWNGTAWTDRPSPGGALAIGGSAGSVLAVSSNGAVLKFLGTTWGASDAGIGPTNAAVVVDGTHVVAARNGAVSFWENGTWTTTSPPVAANWTAIGARSFTDVSVAGLLNGVSHRYRWNGAAWSAIDDAGDTGLPQALWSDPTGNVWAPTSDGQVRVWTGTTWARKAFGDNFVQSGWGTAENDIWLAAVPYVGDGTFRNRLTHWDGTAWTEAPFPFAVSPYRFGRMWGSAPNNYWLAGGKRITGGDWERYMFHWDGSAWTAQGPFGITSVAFGAGFTAVWGTASNDVYAVAPGALYHFDGTSWTQVPGVPGGVDVFGSAANEVNVISLAGNELWRWNGTGWSTKTIPRTVDRGWSNAANDVWLAGIAGASHFDGAFFVQLPVGGGIPFGTATEMYVINSESIVKWSSGIAGPSAIAGSAFFSPYGGVWRAPTGRLYAAGGGLLVHE